MLVARWTNRVMAERCRVGKRIVDLERKGNVVLEPSGGSCRPVFVLSGGAQAGHPQTECIEPKRLPGRQTGPAECAPEHASAFDRSRSKPFLQRRGEWDRRTGCWRARVFASTNV